MLGNNPYNTPNPYSSFLYPPPESEAKQPAQQPKPPPPSAPAQPRKNKDEDDDPRYTLKTISYEGRKVRMVCQEFNGPCPLLALCNVLLLRGDAALGAGATVRGAQLLELVANAVLARNPEVAAGDLEAVLRLLPTLQRGLDVNVYFTAGTAGFEATDGLKLFALAGVPLVHGWLADPADAELHAALAGLSYDTAQVAALDAAVPAPRRALVAAWLADAPQLTPHGLRALQHDLGNLAQPPHAGAHDRLAVLFRNNHFAVVCLHAGALYTLVTDEGFADRTAVWELLQETTGDSRFFRDDFTPYGTRTLPLATLQTVPSSSASSKPQQQPATAADVATFNQGPYAAASAPTLSPRAEREMEDEALARQLAARETESGRRAAEQADHDFALALRMQEEEEAAAAAAQRRQGTAPPRRRSAAANKSSSGSNNGKGQKHKKSGHSDCTVQ